MEKIKQIDIDTDSDTEQIATIDKNHNIDKNIQCATVMAMSMASTSYSTVENHPANRNLYLDVPTEMDCDKVIVISSDSEDGYSEEGKATSDGNPHDDDTKNDDNSAHTQVEHGNEEKLPKFESIAARRGQRSSKRPISYNEDKLSVSRDDSDASSDFPKGPTKPRFEVNPARIPKNDDTNMFYSNFLWKSTCLLCGCSDKHLANHYARKHPNTEVFIARLSPKYATRIRTQQDEFIRFDGKIHGLCFFCEELKTMKPDDWKKHLLTHTGEQMYWCAGCQTAMVRKNSHGQCLKDNVNNIFDSSNENLSGFICNTCNYLQIAKHRLIKHIEAEHDSFDNSCSELFSRVILVKSPAV